MPDNDDNSAPAQKMVRYEGEMSKEVSLVYTTKRQLALTFNGMGDKETMLKLLDELDRYHIQSTFFLPGMRVADEPDIARTILSRGHEIENNTLSRVDLTRLSYEKLDSTPSALRWSRFRFVSRRSRDRLDGLSKCSSFTNGLLRIYAMRGSDASAV